MAYPAQLWDVEGNQSTQRKPTQKVYANPQTVALAKITVFSLVLQQNDIQGPAVSER